MFQSHPRSNSFGLCVLSLGVFLGTLAALPAASSECLPTSTNLCLYGSRFEVTAMAKTSLGDTMAGQRVSLTPDAGAFWFFSPENLDISIKVLNGTGINGYFWVFYGGLTSLEYQIDVKDTATGAVKTYTNSKGALTSDGDILAFRDLGAASGSTLVDPLVPKCHFMPAKPQVGGRVDFFDDSTGSPTDWAWAFGDELTAGFSSTDQNPMHVYHDASQFEVRLRVSRPSGAATETAEAVCTEVPVQSSCSLGFVPTEFSPFKPDGGSGSSINVSSSPSDCTWTVTSDQPYLKIISPAGGAGKGSGSIVFQFQANDSLESRAATLTVRLGDAIVKEFSLSQVAGSCDYSLEPLQASFSAAEHSDPPNSVSVRPNFQSCPWKASTTSGFVKLTGTTTGTGNGTVTYTVSENTSTSPRHATLTIQSKAFEVNQAGCIVTPPFSSPYEIGPAEVSQTLSFLADSPSCQWALSGNGSFLTIDSGSYTGSQDLISFHVSPNTSSLSRTGSLTIAGQTIRVLQKGCSSVDSTFVELGSDNPVGKVQVTEEIAGCHWVAESNASFIHVQDIKPAGSGKFDVTFLVDDAGGVERLGTLSVAGQMVIVRQKGDAPPVACASGVGMTFDPLGGVRHLDVTTSPGSCDWQAETDATFFHVQKVGVTSVALCAAANRGALRAGRLTLSEPNSSARSFVVVNQTAPDGGDPTLDCSDADALCLLEHRIEVRATFFDGPASRQVGNAKAITTGSGYFWLFNESPELVVKVIDGRAFTGSFWVFSGALTDLPYTLTVTDVKTGKQVYFCNLNNSFQSFADIETLIASPDPAP
jgi:PKD repeat protein